MLVDFTEIQRLWFDVEMIRYTTLGLSLNTVDALWFDVEMIRYTTDAVPVIEDLGLWFDVEMIRYTTWIQLTSQLLSCGLM